MEFMRCRERDLFLLPFPQGSCLGCKIDIKLFLSLSPCSGAAPFSTNSVLSHVTCFAQWDIRQRSASEDLLKNLRVPRRLPTCYTCNTNNTIWKSPRDPLEKRRIKPSPHRP